MYVRGGCIYCCVYWQDNLGIESDCSWAVPTLPTDGGHMINSAVAKGTYFDYKNPGVKKSDVSILIQSNIVFKQ